MKLYLVLTFLTLAVSSALGMEGKKRKLPAWLEPIKSGKKVKIFDAAATRQLFEAVVYGDLALAGVLVDNYNADINARNGEGFTPLHVATLYQNITMVNLLINLGADPNIRNNKLQDEHNNITDLIYDQAFTSSLTPLELALWQTEQSTSERRKQIIQIIQLLIDRGTDLNPQNVRLTPLHLAAILDPGSELIELLIERGAYVNLMNSNGSTAVDMSIAFLTPSNLSTLFTYGAILSSSRIQKQILEILKILGEDINCSKSLNTLYILLTFGANKVLTGELRNDVQKILLKVQSPLFDVFIKAVTLNLNTRVGNELIKLMNKDLDPIKIQEHFLFALGCDNYMAVKFMLDNFGNSIEQNTRNMAFIRAAQLGYLNILTYLYRVLSPNQTVLNQTFILAARAEAINTFELLYNTGSISSRIVDQVMLKAAQWGQLSIIKSLYKNGAISSERINNIYVEAASHGHVSLLNFFYTIAVIPEETFEQATLNASLNGRIDVIRHILALNPYLNLMHAGRAIKERLATERLANQQRALYEEIFSLLAKHQQARLATLQLESIGRAREQAGLRALPPELITATVSYIR